MLNTALLNYQSLKLDFVNTLLNDYVSLVKFVVERAKLKQVGGDSCSFKHCLITKLQIYVNAYRLDKRTD